jgi:hypothetical protein
MSQQRMSTDRWQMARHFMLTQARPLDRALYLYHFQGGAIGQVVSELAAYQNPDGGFGRALEPDVRCGESSVVATTMALQVLRELRLTPRDEMVRCSIRYLLNTYDADLQAWIPVPATARDAPHAPWWHFDEYPPQRWEGCQGNPRPEILGYLHDYQELVPPDLLEDLTNSVLRHLKAQPDTMEMHDFLCYVRLVETRLLPPAVRTPVLARLRALAPKIVATDEAQWSKYGLPPLSAADSPASSLADLFADPIHRQLDFELNRQQDDGGWAATWSWGNTNYPEPAEAASRDWRSYTTLKTLKALQAFGRLP